MVGWRLVALVHSDWNVLLEELSRWKQVYRGGDLVFTMPTNSGTSYSAQ